jgi:hypothetical protein
MDHAFKQIRVNTHAQVRTMLLGGGYGEHGDGAGFVELVERLGSQVGPKPCLEVWGLING